MKSFLGNALAQWPRKCCLLGLWDPGNKDQSCSSQEMFFNWDFFAPGFPKSKIPQNCHIAKNHSAPNPTLSSNVNFVAKSIRYFTLYVSIKTANWAFFIKSTNVDLYDSINEFDDTNLKEKLISCQHFLVDSEFERARHKVFNYAIENFNATIVVEKLDLFVKDLKCAANLNLAFGFTLKNIEAGGFRRFYAHENNTLVDGSKLVCTMEDLAQPKDFLNENEVIEGKK